MRTYLGLGARDRAVRAGEAVWWASGVFYWIERRSLGGSMGEDLRLGEARGRGDCGSWVEMGRWLVGSRVCMYMGKINDVARVHYVSKMFRSPDAHVMYRDRHLARSGASGGRVVRAW